MKKKTILILSTLVFVLITILFSNVVKVDASSYNYDFYSNPVYSSEGLSYKDTLYFDYMFENSPYGKLSETDNPYYLKKNRKNFTTLSDISIDNTTKTMYLIDSGENESEIYNLAVRVNSGWDTAEIQKNSSLYVLNSEFKVEYCCDIFRITPSVQAKLAAYYNVSTDPTQFSKEQIVSTKTLESPERRCPFFAANLSVTNLSALTEEELTDLTYETYVYLYSAQGVYIKGHYLYLADTMNSRIFRADIDNEYIIDEVYLTPNDITFFQLASEEDQSTALVFQPAKIAIDSDGRVYTISSNTYQGIIEYKQNGEFNRFLGKNLVTKRSWWTFLLSEAQYQKLALNLPSQFTNLVIDDRDLIYATCRPNAASTTVAAEMIKLINTSGSDVLVRNGYVKPDGDVKYMSYVKPAITGPSIFVGITVNDARIFSVVDQTRGRIFSYDDEGNLLYVSGEFGDLSNNIKLPAGLVYYEHDDQEYVLVLDQGSHSLIIFETTEFGKLVNDATRLYLNNDIDKARVKWEEVVKMNSNYELGYVGIGKSILRNANTAQDPKEKLALYKEAMDYFTLGHNKVYYSNAYKQYRNIILKNNFGLFMTGIVIVAVVGIGVGILSRHNRKLKQKKAREEVENNAKRNDIQS